MAAALVANNYTDIVWLESGGDQMTWKKFSKEKPREGALIRLRRTYVEMSVSHEQYIGTYREPLMLERSLSLGSVHSDMFPIYIRVDEWQEVPE